MNETDMPASQDGVQHVPPARQRRRHRSMGASLLAEGEPMVWLAGGAFVAALAMIVWILGLILYQGLMTFLPRPIVLLELKDGRALMGEVVRSEADVPQTADADRTGPAGRNPPASAHRRMLRTGNFDLTNTHFDWVSDTEVVADGESLPAWALTLERMEWGRFYGIPQQLSVHHPRPVEADEATLLAVVQTLQANVWRFEPADEIEAFASSLQRQLRELRRARVENLLQSIPRDGPADTEVLLEDGRTLKLQDLNADLQPDVVGWRQVWNGSEAAWKQFVELHRPARQRLRKRRSLEKHDLGRLNSRMEKTRLQVRQAEMNYGVDAASIKDELDQVSRTLMVLDIASQEAEKSLAAAKRFAAANPGWTEVVTQIETALVDELVEQRKEPLTRQQVLRETLGNLPEPVRLAVDNQTDVVQQALLETKHVEDEIAAMREEDKRYQFTLKTADAQDYSIQLGEVVRAYPPNRMSTLQKASVYLSRWNEFLTDEPREANSEGGVFPAIWGTVAMTLIMSLIVVPFGVLAALYLSEYATAGITVSAVRIAINNLAGVPSIVFGVFGLGFFCYVFGAFVDGGPENAGIPVMPGTQWYMLAGCLTVAALVALGSSIAVAFTTDPRSTRLLGNLSACLWMATVLLAVPTVLASPFFVGLFAAKLPNPTYGKGGILWASLTLSLLTLPVVIVATEEALSAVPNSLRLGSYASGASKWQTIRRIVLPHAMPGIMTGMILAMARGAGEVAPLMLVGAVKLAPELPVDGIFPYVHGDRSFMHLGFHIFDLGFQSQNSDAAKPMVFTTTLLLIAIIALLNVVAIYLRARLRRRFKSSEF